MTIFANYPLALLTAVAVVVTAVTLLLISIGMGMLIYKLFDEPKWKLVENSPPSMSGVFDLLLRVENKSKSGDGLCTIWSIIMMIVNPICVNSVMEFMRAGSWKELGTCFQSEVTEAIVTLGMAFLLIIWTAMTGLFLEYGAILRWYLTTGREEWEFLHRTRRKRRQGKVYQR